MKKLIIFLLISICYGQYNQLVYSGLTILNLTISGTADAYMCKDVPDSVKNCILWDLWKTENKHILWLGFDNLILPISRCYTAKYFYNNILQFSLNTAGSYLIGSVFWDLVFKKMTKGVWIAREDWWFIIGNHKIAFTKKQYIVFHTIRLIIGSALIYYSF